MNSAQLVEVDVDDSDVRLDRWFRRHYPELNHGYLEKMLRKGQVRVDGAKVKAGHRLAPGQLVRVPPLELSTPKPRAKVSDHDSRELRRRILYRDLSVLVLDKPAGLAVQGGSGTKLPEYASAMPPCRDTGQCFSFHQEISAKNVQKLENVTTINVFFLFQLSLARAAGKF